jgi:thiamine pyrophosphate-dependent acetolactate synthase large subunit-like protein
LDLEDMKLMMETLGAPQTHLSLKAMIQEVDTDGDSKISFNEFLLIYHKAKAGQLDADSGLNALAKITEVDINEVGVDGAKNFFEAKIEQLKAQSKFEEEVKKEQEERRRQEQERKQKRQEFQQKHAFFEQVTLTN